MLLLGYCFILLVWGLTPLVIAISLQDVPLLSSLLMRLMIIIVLVLPIFLFTRRFISLHYSHLKAYAWASLKISIGFPLTYWAVAQLGAALTAVALSSLPLVMALMQLLTGQVKIKFSCVLFLIPLALLGFYLVFEPWFISVEHVVLPLLAILLVNVITASFVLGLKRAKNKAAAFDLAIGSNLMALPPLLLLAFWVDGEVVLSVSASVWFSAGALALFSSLLAIIIYYWLIKRVDVIYIALLPLLTPIVGVLVSVAVLKESFVFQQIGGLLLILMAIAGVVLRSVRDKRVVSFKDVPMTEHFKEEAQSIVDRYR